MDLTSETTARNRWLTALRFHLHSDSVCDNWRKLGFYFRRRDHYWIISPRMTKLPAEPLGTYPLDFSAQLRAGHYSPLDGDGIPVRRSRDGRTFVHNYTRICGFALAHWNMYLQTGYEGHLAPVVKSADYILASAEHAQDAVYLKEERPGKGHTGPISSMSQGQAMSVLCRAWQATLRDEYLQAAIGSLQPFTIAAKHGGVLSAIHKLDAPWFEE